MVGNCENNGKRKRRVARRKHEDLISQLPDEILISIISGLTVQQASAATLISSRWRYLSPYITRLCFPPFIPKWTNTEKFQEIKTRFPPYISAINRVLDSHKGGHVKEFRVHTCHLEGANIGKWFEFALAKEVEIIDICMERVGYYTIGSDGYYPLHQWENYNLVGEGQTLKCLKQLSLRGIDVDGVEIQLLLSKFPLLESLSIAYSGTLNHASIVGDSTSKLKHLDITRCVYMVELIIENFVNLVSLGCNDMVGFTLTLKNVPKLIEFSMRDSIGRLGFCSGARILARMQSYIPDQLQTLKIFIPKFPTIDYTMSSIPELSNLKSLELGYGLRRRDDIPSSHPLHTLCRACPSLEKIEIKFTLWCRRPSEINMKGDESINSYLEGMWQRMSETKLCPNLKKMKISGFVGSLQELGFVFTILTIVGGLEELVVEVCHGNKKNRTLFPERAWHHFRSRAARVVVV